MAPSAGRRRGSTISSICPPRALPRCGSSSPPALSPGASARAAARAVRRDALASPLAQRRLARGRDGRRARPQARRTAHLWRDAGRRRLHGGGPARGDRRRHPARAYALPDRLRDRRCWRWRARRSSRKPEQSRRGRDAPRRWSASASSVRSTVALVGELRRCAERREPRRALAVVGEQPVHIGARRRARPPTSPRRVRPSAKRSSGRAQSAPVGPADMHLVAREGRAVGDALALDLRAASCRPSARSRRRAGRGPRPRRAAPRSLADRRRSRPSI